MLKQLKLRAERREKEMKLTALRAKAEELNTRQQVAVKALDEAENDADMEAINAEVRAIEQEMQEAGLPDALTVLEGEISDIDAQLDEISERAKNPMPPKSGSDNKNERGNNMNRMQIRELLKSGAYYERAEVKEFYDKFRNLRSVTGEGLTVPNIVVNRIMDIMGDFTTLYPLVDHVRVNGTLRILLDTDTTAAEWIEQIGVLPEGDVGTITSVDFDGFKVGKVTFVDNSMLQDSIINLDDYVTRKLARSIALALDKAIVNGEGSAQKQPDGIIPKMPAANKVTVTAPTSYADIVKPIGLIDTGEDSVGEIVAVMKRQTYYNRCLEYSINPNSAGDTVGKLPNLRMPDLLGLRVVFNNNIPADAILYGDFSKYTLVERESITIDKSEHVKFKEDQTGFRGKGRYDGKPTKPEAFVLVTITGAAPAPAAASVTPPAGGDAPTGE